MLGVGILRHVDPDQRMLAHLNARRAQSYAQSVQLFQRTSSSKLTHFARGAYVRVGIVSHGGTHLETVNCDIPKDECADNFFSHKLTSCQDRILGFWGQWTSTEGVSRL